MSSHFSPARPTTSGSSRLQHHFVNAGPSSRQISSPTKNVPEPLRRAVVDCLSSVVVSESSINLRDYLAASATTDLTYSVILEHTIAERERSPAVVARCMILLKRYLLRYIPSEDVLFQIDQFCSRTIADCNIGPNRHAPSELPSQQSDSSTSFNAPLLSTVSTFASGALVKSLKYVRALAARHICRRPFQPLAFSGAPFSARQPTRMLSPSLSPLLTERLGRSEPGECSVVNESNTSPTDFDVGKDDVNECDGYVPLDLLKWRWPEEQLSSSVPAESDLNKDFELLRGSYNFLESGASALLAGDVDGKMKCPVFKFNVEKPHLSPQQLSSSAATISSYAQYWCHLRAITAYKRSKSGPQEIWENASMKTSRLRAWPLFQYRPYSEQQPLLLNPSEVGEVITAVSSDTCSPSVNSQCYNSGAPWIDVAASVLIKLVFDMYLSDSKTASPLLLSMLLEMLGSSKATHRTRVFDLILNIGVHAHLLEPTMSDDASTIEQENSQDPFSKSEDHPASSRNVKDNYPNKSVNVLAVDNFESWILKIFYETLLFLVQIEDKEESVWAAALSCLLYFVCDGQKIWRSRLAGLDIRVIKVLIETSRENSWAEVVHSMLVFMLAYMFYHVSNGNNLPISQPPVFLADQVELIGGIEFILYEYSLACLKNEKRTLYLLLLDYVLLQVNEARKVAGLSECTDNEIHHISSLLSLADAPEAYYISIKHGVAGAAALLRRATVSKLSCFSKNERLNLIFEETMTKFDAVICSFTQLDEEFHDQMQITMSCKFPKSLDSGAQFDDDMLKARLSWATLHSLLHSDRVSCRRNGYAWLVNLIVGEISGGKDTSILSNMRDLQHRLVYVSVHGSFIPSVVPLSVQLLCGLLKSKHNITRLGFLLVLEKLLMHCKFLVDGFDVKALSGSRASHECWDVRLEKANVLIDIMSSALSLVAQINETDRINILKMCDVLFSQLCLTVAPETEIFYGKGLAHANPYNSGMDENKSIPTFQQEIFLRNTVSKPADSSMLSFISNILNCEMASMATLLLQGQAFIPMQLVVRMPTSLFYWPLIQLAGAATDNISLGVAVGSKGKGNLPGAVSDIRVALLLLLISKCTEDPSAFQDVGGEEFFRELIDDKDSRIAYHSSAFLLKRMMSENPNEYQNMLQNLILKAQQSNNEQLLENPYLQMRGILQL